ncbi:MAG: hypothetical protein RL331_176 [Bacteroidota bacterium]
MRFGHVVEDFPSCTRFLLFNEHCGISHEFNAEFLILQFTKC